MSGFFKIIEKTQAWKNSTDQKTHMDFDFVMPEWTDQTGGDST